ncbi:hypothetical protein SAMN06265361_107129 [Laceyella tengchongensis]|uniref:Uncharacterized protein n=1 Tax=Laceyella tengchongensis TaxID=574699 RepID=A0AA45WRE8_9BACL|nr:hypothetical protein SAMN06265361_107129 [Laceyella tengchongensis]
MGYFDMAKRWTLKNIRSFVAPVLKVMQNDTKGWCLDKPPAVPRRGFCLLAKGRKPIKALDNPKDKICRKNFLFIQTV